MKRILMTTVVAIVATAALRAEPAPDALAPSVSKDEPLAGSTRTPWIKSKAYLSENPATFHEGARQKLTLLEEEIAAVAAKGGENPPQYFQTRIRSMKEQHGYLVQKLRELNDEATKIRMSGPRYAFDLCVGFLESALSQAADEAETLTRSGSQKTGGSTLHL